MRSFQKYTAQEEKLWEELSNLLLTNNERLFNHIRGFLGRLILIAFSQFSARFFGWHEKIKVRNLSWKVQHEYICVKCYVNQRFLNHKQRFKDNIDDLVEGRARLLFQIRAQDDHLIFELTGQFKTGELKLLTKNEPYPPIDAIQDLIQLFPNRFSWNESSSTHRRLEPLSALPQNLVCYPVVGPEQIWWVCHANRWIVIVWNWV